jgi:two-component system OmpR family response regulator
MLVEDDHALRRMMDAILRTAGHKVVAAEDAATALNQLAPDQELILLDLGLPDLDGSTFLAEAAHRGYDGKVLVVSGAVDGQHIADLMGAEGFLPKPFTPDQLESAVKETLRPR